MRALVVALVFLFGVVHADGQGSVSAGWPEHGGTASGQRYSSAEQINRQTVNGLRVAWVFHTHVFDKRSPSSNWRASFEATPVLWNKTLYLTTPFNEVIALNAANGTLRWRFDPQVDREKPIYIVTSRGVALWHAAKGTAAVCGAHVVLMATLDRRLIARDATTGEACPHFGNAGTVDLAQGVAIGKLHHLEYTSPPQVVGNVIVLGSSVADNQETFAASGAVRGFDAVTGRQLWLFEPLADNRGGTAHRAGSGNAWAPLAADPEHDLVFLPTGSASVDFYGGTRPGDNRDANSIVALRASTGERVWAFQLVHHDIWDYDLPAQPLLFTFRHQIPAIAIVTKTSMVYVFNRLNGEPLYPIVERPVAQSKLAGEVTSPTQPYSTLPSLTPLRFTANDIQLPHSEDQEFCRDFLKKVDNFGVFTPPSTSGTLIYPGDLGGANWGSAAFDPESSVLYTRVSSAAFLVQHLKNYPGKTFGQRVYRELKLGLPTWMGGDPPPLVESDASTPDSGGTHEKEGSAQSGTPYRLAREVFMTPGGVPCAPQPFGSIIALNLDSGRKLWSVPHGQMAPGTTGSTGVGGVIATKGKLVFAASTSDAVLRAYDSETGKELWQGKLEAPANATPMTYTLGGRQFVVICAGGHGFLGKGKSDAVMAFALPAKTRTP